MALAFVLIQCGNMDVDGIIEELKKVKSVTNIQGLFGMYDIVIKVRASDNKTLDEVISTQIRSIKKLGVTHTLLICNSDDEWIILNLNYNLIIIYLIIFTFGNF